MTDIPKQVALRLKYGDAICELCNAGKHTVKADGIVHHRKSGKSLTRCLTCIRAFRNQYDKVEYFE